MYLFCPTKLIYMYISMYGADKLGHGLCLYYISRYIHLVLEKDKLIMSYNGDINE